MIRDTRKDTQYFMSYMDDQKRRIKREEQKLLYSTRSSEKRINRAILMYKLDLMTAGFSGGAGKQELINFLDDMYDTALEIERIDYEQMLVILSVSIISGYRSDKIQALIHKQCRMIDADRLLHCFAVYLCNGCVKWTGKFLYDIFSALEPLEKADNKEKILSEYLDTWYENHKYFAWYGSDKNGKDTYTGYWSFETAALAIIFNVPDKELKKNVYFPEI